MKIFDYSKSQLSLDDAQFLIAITLDEMTDTKVTSLVLKLYGTYAYGSSNSAANAENVVKRTELHEQFSRSNQDPVSFLIDFLWNNRVLGDGKFKKDLSQLAPHLNLHSLYEKVMQKCFQYTPAQYITLYVRTNTFKVQYRKYIKKFINNNVARNNSYISDITLNELHSAFCDFVSRGARYQYYHAETGNPDAVIFSTDDDKGGDEVSRGGTALWFSKSDQFYEILNKSGLNATIYSDGDDDLSLLDYQTVEESSKEYPIDFISVCTRIGRASLLLFNHKGGIEAYYDIFSYHRDQVINETQQKFKKERNRLGYDVSFEQDMIAINADINTVSSKKKYRTMICDIFEKAMHGNLRKSEIYSRLYREIISTTERIPAKNAHRLFRTADVQTRHNESNGEMLQILLDGYIALYEFLNFLESSSNHTNVTMNSFNCDIFRDSRILRRVKSFEEYVDYHDDIMPLFSEADKRLGDPTNSHSSDAILPNDTVYNMLSGVNMLKDDVVLQHIMNFPIASIGNIVHMHEGKRCDNDLLKEFSNMRYYWRNFYTSCRSLCKIPIFEKNIVNDSTTGLDFVQLEEVVGNRAYNIVNNRLSDRAITSVYPMIAFFGKLYELAMLAEGNPVCDSTGKFNLTEDNYMEALCVPAEFHEEIETALKKSSGYAKMLTILRGRALLVCMNILWGRPITGKFDCSLKEIRFFFKITDALWSFFESYHSMFNYMDGFSDDLYLMVAFAASRGEMFGIADSISSDSSMGFLYNDDRKSYLPEYSSNMVRQALQEDKEYRSILREIAKTILERYQTLFNCLRNFQKKVDTSYHMLSYVSGYDPVVETSLRNAAASVMSISHKSDEVKALSNIIRATMQRDSYGYVLINGVRYGSPNREYYHTTGYVVQLDALDNSFSAREMNQDDLETIRLLQRI